MEVRYHKSGKIYIKFKDGVVWLMSIEEAEELVEKLSKLIQGKE